MPITNVHGRSPSAAPGGARQQSTSTAAQGNQLFNQAAGMKAGNPPGAADGADQTQAAANASRTGKDIADASKTLEKAKQDVTTAQGMNELMTYWVKSLWKS